ncbi:hypothetical protein GLOIN_2v1770575 [Rhizophagus irregularis DAOM 181602=DAOM 197198]|nr:hypothetical protein GLOIN_2v1770575 [Rhizophagus irregularis DAOM 181602=DAOM 197198]
MYTSTISDQTDQETLAHYDDASPGEFLSESDSYNDNDSNCGSDDYNNYESNYESDNEEASCALTSTTEAVKERKVYVTYTLSEVENKLVIKIDQDADHAPKFSVADDISEVYGLPGIHECINGQKPLRAVIDIDALQEDIEATVIATSSDPSKCSYHILYTPVLLIDHHKLKAFTELVYTITGEKFGKYIDRELPGQNFNLRLIGSAKKGRVKRILQFSLDNGWNTLDHARVQLPTSLRLEDVLQKCANLVLQKHSNYLRNWAIEEKDSENFVYFNQKAPLECPLCKRICCALD